MAGLQVSDPIAQTFLIPDDAQNEVIGVDSIDLYFQTKDPYLGCEVQIREIVNGYPGPNIVGYGKIRVPANNINTSANGSIKTRFKFPALIFLKTGRDYCFVVLPDGNNPNYKLWVAEIGGVDVTTGAPIYTNSGVGVMFTSTNNGAWSAYQREDVKFSINIAKFDPLIARATMTNDDIEFLKIDPISLHSMSIGEKVFQVDSLVTANAVVSNNSPSITVSNGALFAINTKYLLTNNTKTKFALINLNAIDGNTLTSRVNLKITDSAVSLYSLKGSGGLYGYLKTYDQSKFELHLDKSTANSTVNFTANNWLVGENTWGVANTTQVLNVPFNNIVSKIGTVVPINTELYASYQGMNNSLIMDASPRRISLNAGENEFDDVERVVLSRSNEITQNSGNKSVKIYLDLLSMTNKMSPQISLEKNSNIFVHNLINSNANNEIYTTEKTEYGTAWNRYISKKAVLEEGQDAEDLNVYVTAYRPPGTTILVYCKLLNNTDPEDFETKLWTPMQLNNNMYSSRVNKNDFIEFEYIIPRIYTGDPVPSDSTAFVNVPNLSIVRYKNNAGVNFDGFKIYAIKIILTSEVGSHQIPRVADYRAIALQSQA